MSTTAMTERSVFRTVSGVGQGHLLRVWHLLKHAAFQYARRQCGKPTGSFWIASLSQGNTRTGSAPASRRPSASSTSGKISATPRSTWISFSRSVRTQYVSSSKVAPRPPALSPLELVSPVYGLVEEMPGKI